jgi:hypothetical protein
MLLQIADRHGTWFIALTTLFAVCLLTAPTSAEELGADLVIVPPLSTEAEAAIKRAFLERNPGVTWEPDHPKVDRYGKQRLGLASESSSVTRTMGPRNQAREIAVAREFARRNADLLGITPEAVATLRARFDSSTSRLMYLESDGLLPYPGYEHLVAFGYQVDLRFVVDGETVTFVLNRSDRLPDFPRLNSTPSIPADSPVILSQLHQYVPGVGFGTMGPPVLTIWAPMQRNNKPWRIQLVWRYDVVDGLAEGSYIFNAHTGELFIEKPDISDDCSTSFWCPSGEE